MRDKNKFGIRDSESGRSMVEMLAVLAVMGLLSLGAVSGFKMALDMWRAARTVEDVKQRIIIFSTQLMSIDTIDESEFGNESSVGYPIHSYLNEYEEGDTVEIVVDDVHKGTCREILKKEWDFPLYIEADGYDFVGDIDICRNERVRMIFEFSEDFAELVEPEPPPCRTHDDCDNVCGSCIDGQCEPQCDPGYKCVRSVNDARIKTCQPYESLLNGIGCAEIKDNTCCSSWGTCCPADKPLMDSKGNCHSCSEDAAVYVNGFETACYICDGENGRDKLVLVGNYCAHPCPSQKPLMDSSGNCHRCDEYKNISMASVDGKSPEEVCTSVCDGSDKDIHMKRSYGANGYRFCEYPCPDNEVSTSNDSEPCRPCTTKAAIEVTYRDANESARFNGCVSTCDGSSADKPKRVTRSRYNGQTMCMLAECPADKPIKDWTGNCQPCTNENGKVPDIDVRLEDVDTCTQCSNRTIKGLKCIAKANCPGDMVYDAENNRCVCPPETPLQAKNGKCYSCDEPNPVDMSGFLVYKVDENGSVVGEETTDTVDGEWTGDRNIAGCEDVCPNRVSHTDFFPRQNMCMLPCADDEFYTSSGCKKCNDPKVYSMYADGAECLACNKNGKTLRVCTDGGQISSSCHYCALVCPEGQIMAGDGTCHSCDDENPWLILGKQCTDVCGGLRYQVDNTCFKCPKGFYATESGDICNQCPMSTKLETVIFAEQDCIACGGIWNEDETKCSPPPQEPGGNNEESAESV